MRLSPNGQFVAYVQAAERGQHLVVFDLTSRQGRVIERADGVTSEIVWIEWKNDDRLILGVRYNTVLSVSGVMHMSDEWRLRIDRVFAVNRDGSSSVQMFGDEARQSNRTAFGSTRLIDSLPGSPNEILVEAWDNLGFGVWRADITTGRVVRVDNGERDTYRYVTDGAGRAVIRMDRVGRGSYRVLRRASDAEDWILYREVRRTAGATNSPDFVPGAAGPGPNQVYVLARPDNQDLLGLYLFDTSTGELGAPLQQGAAADVAEPWIHPGTRAVLAQCEDARQLRCTATDRDVARHLRAVETFLGADVSVHLVNMSTDANTWLLHAYGPREPGAYYIYNRASANVQVLAPQNSRVQRAALSPTRVMEYASRDGASLWAYVTAQPGEGARPVIVMPHGGPEARDHYAYDPLAQYFASRGYVVLQPNFRGGDGFGRAFADAGRGQWGQRMQHDITDALQHLVASGAGDGARVCIVGWSYGGYAALAGLATTPELYRCGVSIAGVADLEEFLRSERAERGRTARNFQYWSRSIGDPAEAVSPARMADRITAPLMMFHGSEDEIVLPEQSEIMQRAMEAAGKPSMLVPVPGARHSMDSFSPEQRAFLLEQSEIFVARHIGASASQ